MKRTVTEDEARGSFDEIIDQVACGGDDVVIERNGTPAVVLVRTERYEQMRKAQAESLWEMVAEVHERNKDVSPEEVEAMVNEVFDEIRGKTGRSTAN